MAERKPDDRVVISHPDIEAISVVTRRQLDETWAEQGFVEVEGADPDNPFIADDAQPAVELPPEQPSLEDMTKDQLKAHAESLELEVPSGATKAEIIDMIQGGPSNG